MTTATRWSMTALLAVWLSTMTGCFTISHLAGIDHANALRREFAVTNEPPRFPLGLVRLRFPEPVKGGWTGPAQRDGVLFNEYQFASTLVSDDGKRCLRVLIPVAEGNEHAVVIEEFEGEASTEKPVWLYYERDLPIGQFSSGQIPFEATVIELGLDESRAAWTMGQGDDRVRRKADLKDCLRRQERNHGEVILRILTTPVAVVGDVGLAAALLVAAPFHAIHALIFPTGE